MIKLQHTRKSNDDAMRNKEQYGMEAKVYIRDGDDHNMYIVFNLFYNGVIHVMIASCLYALRQCHP